MSSERARNFRTLYPAFPGAQYERQQGTESEQGTTDPQASSHSKGTIGVGAKGTDNDRSEEEVHYTGSRPYSQTYRPLLWVKDLERRPLRLRRPTREMIPSIRDDQCAGQ